MIDSVPVKHTASITGNTVYAGNSGMWQGVLSRGRHTIAVEHRSSSTYTHYVNDDFYARAMDIIRCYIEFHIQYAIQDCTYIHSYFTYAH